MSRSKLVLLKWSFDRSIAISLLKDSWPLVLSGLVVSIYMKIDQVMISEMIGLDAVGHYAAAVKLSEAWYFIPVVIASSLFPAIANARNTNSKLYLQRLQRLLSLMVLLSISVALPITYFSDRIVVTLYGEDYSNAGTVLTIHVWSAVFVFLGVASSKWLVLENFAIYAFIRTLMGALVNVCLNMILIPEHGIVGAAYALIISQMVAGYFADTLNKNTRVMFFMKTKALFLRGIC